MGKLPLFLMPSDIDGTTTTPGEMESQFEGRDATKVIHTSPGTLPSCGVPYRELAGLSALLEQRGFGGQDVQSPQLGQDALPDEGFQAALDAAVADALDERNDTPLESPQNNPSMLPELDDNTSLLSSSDETVDEVDAVTVIDVSPVSFELAEDPVHVRSEAERTVPKSMEMVSASGIEFAITPVDVSRRRPHDPQAAAIFDMRKKMAHQNPFQVLGLGVNAPLSAIRDAHARLLRKYDASKFADALLPHESLNDLKELREHITFCTKSLCDPTKRAVLERLAGGDADAVRLRGYFSADQHFRTALKHMRSKAFETAIYCIEQAIIDDPNEPEYYTRLAQAQIEIARSGSRFNLEVQQSVEAVLQKALDIDDRYEPAQLLMGRVLIAQRRFQDAHRVYQRLMTANPRNQEARRAVRELSKKFPVDEPVKGTDKFAGLFSRFTKDD